MIGNIIGICVVIGIPLLLIVFGLGFWAGSASTAHRAQQFQAARKRVTTTGATVFEWRGEYGWEFDRFYSDGVETPGSKTDG